MGFWKDAYLNWDQLQILEWLEKRTRYDHRRDDAAKSKSFKIIHYFSFVKNFVLMCVYKNNYPNPSL